MIILHFIVGLPLLASAQKPGSCTEQASFQLFPEPEAPQCENFTINLLVGDGHFQPTVSDVFPNTSTIQNVNFKVSGTWILDKSFTFVNCRVFFDEQSQLITSGNVTLGAEQQTWFRPCENHMWTGITLNAGSALQMSDSYIYGAEQAINCRKDYRAADSYMVNCHLYRNRVCIRGDEPGTLISFNPFYRNRFSGNQALPGLPNQFPIAGVEAFNCTVNLGTIFNYPPNDPIFSEEDLYLSYANTFANFFYGIDAQNSTIAVRNIRFFSMRPGTPNNSAGIRSNNGRVVVSGLPDPGNDRTLGFCEFINCQFAGISAIACELNVNYAKFLFAQEFGVRSAQPGLRRQQVYKCRFYFNNDINDCGIYVERPDGPSLLSRLRIYDNVFEGGGLDGMRGIEAQALTPSSGPFLIGKNSFSMAASSTNGIFYGILVYGNQSHNLNVLENTLDLVSPGPKISDFGIFMTDCEGAGHEVSDNTSVGEITCNFHIQRTRNTGYCSDITGDATHGFHFMGDNLNTYWSVSDIGAHFEGLHIEDLVDGQSGSLSAGKIGDQIRHGNMWEADDALYAAHAARCDANTDDSQFIVESTFSSIKPTKTFPLNWFVEVEGPLNYCRFSLSGLTDYERRIISGEVDLDSMPAYEAWDLKRRLVRTLLDDPAGTAADPDLSTWLAAQSGASARTFAEAERFLADTAWADPTAAAQLHTLRELADSIWVNTSATADTSLTALESQISTLRSALDSARIVHFQAALQIFDSIPVTVQYEYGWKILRTYEIRRALGQSETQAGFPDIYALAHAGADYGYAVLQARHHVAGCVRDSLTTPEGENSSRPLLAADKTQPPASLQAVPNPADASVRISAAQSLRGEWLLYSAAGLPKRRGDWEGASLLLDTSELPAGVWHLALRDEAGRTHYARFVVVH